MSTTLGLDLGTNSIGWAFIDNDAQRIVAAGTRVFPEGVDNFDTSKEKSRNEDRRIARGMRRQIRRRAYRKQQLREALIEAGLFPSDPDEQQALLMQDPYFLRDKAMSGKLVPHEIGRVFLHLNQRRGFLSNRKKDHGDKEIKGMLAEISELEAQLDGQTLGQYLHGQTAKPGQIPTPGNHIRNKHTRRSMLVDEFDRIWKAQSKHHPQLLTNMLRHGSKKTAEHYPKKPRKSRSRIGGFFELIDGIGHRAHITHPGMWVQKIRGQSTR